MKLKGTRIMKLKGTRMYELDRLRKLNLTYEQAMEKFGANEKPWMELNSAEQDLIIELLEEKNK